MLERAMKQAQKTEEIIEGQPEKQWWEDEKNIRPISEWTLQKNEWLDIT